MTALLLDHVWQSTIVLAGIGLLTLCFRRNGAHVRHALWMAASLKFLVPFALLNGLGHSLSNLLAAPPVQTMAVQAVFAASQPFSDGPVFVALPAPSVYALAATILWLAGMLAVIVFWLSRWLKLRAALHAARATDVVAPMPVRMSATLLEPGLVGIFRPVLLLPEGIAEKLDPAELQAIIAHEACHLRRRDNLTAALHMLVEAIFWFWPPVWWLGTRLVAERERACDEAVLQAGNDPQTYASSILKVCKHYVASPLACASGVSGADLKQRMEEIMKNSIVARLNVSKKALLAASAAVALALPLAAGVFTVPVLAQSNANGSSGNSAAQTYFGGAEPHPLSRKPTVTRPDNTPSPGLAESLRHFSETLLRGEPDYGLMTPRLVAATRESLQFPLLVDAKRLGTVRAVIFRGVSSRGWDMYEVRYANGTASYEAAPLVNGKLDQLMWGDVLVPGQPEHAGTRAELTKYVQALQAGAPNYPDLHPKMATTVRRDFAMLHNMVLPWGAQTSITYVGGGMGGLDVYDVTYEHGQYRWLVAKGDGKLAFASGPHVGFWD
jgi:beta-lactamase regulating signal transducer with metallopeptidase domain